MWIVVEQLCTTTTANVAKVLDFIGLWKVLKYNSCYTFKSIFPMAKAPKNHGSDDSDDIRLALKMPARGGLENRQIATAFSKIKRALRSSSGGGGRSGISSRQRGSAAAGSAAAKAGMQKARAGQAVANAKPLQRVAVRWTYSKNQSDGQWGAHGKYIERESAQDIEQDRERQDVQQDHAGRELDDETISTEKELSNERPSRYDGPGAVFTPGRISALRQSYAAAIARVPQAKSINDLRSLSSLDLVQRTGQRELLLQGDAPQIVLKRGPEGNLGVRRPGDGRRGASGRSHVVNRSAPGFGSGGDSMPIAATLASWQSSGDERMFKLIISPEFGDRMNLKKHVSDLVKQMEKDLGTKLEWVAVEHHNTDHPHAHVAIRGVDDRGQNLEVSPEYIAQGSRIRAQELATRELGYRSDRDVAEAMDRQVAQQRFTDIDRTLLKAGNEQGALNVDAGLLRAAQSNPARQIDFSGVSPSDPAKRALRLAQIERLTFLEKHGLTKRVGEMVWTVSPELATRKPEGEKILRFDNQPPANERARDARLLQIRRLVQLTEMGLAEKVGNLSWRLKPTMESALRQMQIAQDRLKTKFAHREMISDPSAPLVVTELKTLGQRVTGKVVGTGLNEATNRAYILIEGFDGKVHYVNQNAGVQKLRGEGGLKAGEYVSLEIVERRDASGRLQGTKQKIERFGNTITPDLLDQELLKAGKVVERPTIKQTVAGMFRDAAATRLERLHAAGAIEVVAGAVLRKSAVAHDQVSYEDAGIRAVSFDGKGAMLASVVAKGRESVAVAPTYGRKQIITAGQLQEMGLPAKFIVGEATIFVGTDSTGKAVASVIKPEKLPAMVADRRPNRLDSMLQQLHSVQLPPTHAVTDAVRGRAAVWNERGVDPMSKEFLLKANMWRKSVELHEAAQEKGVDNVLEGLSKKLGKPVREMPCEPGRQVSGRVLLVNKNADGQTSVVIDSGRELTTLNVPLSAESAVSATAGQRLRARAEKISNDNADRRMMTWRFADLEREEARAKGKGREGKLF